MYFCFGSKAVVQQTTTCETGEVSTLRYWSSSYEGGSESLAMHDAVGLKKRGRAEWQAPLPHDAVSRLNRLL
jgi:hypothetical protein